MRSILFVSLLSVAVSEYVSYKGCKVWRLFPETDQQLFELNVLQTNAKYDFWKEASVVGEAVDIMTCGDESFELKTFFTQTGLSAYPFIDDVDTAITKTLGKERIHTKPGWTFDDYNTFDEIQSGMDALAEQYEDAEVEHIGFSYEGRDLRVIKITRPGANRRAVWLDCTIHAREWISPATCQYAMIRLLEDFDTDETVHQLRTAFDWYIQPVVNPDGYEYTFTTDRLWRKTRQPSNASECIGTDGNRNFGYGWGGASNNPCSQSYRGDAPFSEPETQVLDDYVTPIGSNFDLGLTIHCYGQLILYPWGYTADYDPENMEDIIEVAENAVSAMFDVHGMTYVPQRSSGGMPGNTIDWCMGKQGMSFAYLYELRDEGEYGFLLPPDQILPTVEEVWAGIKQMALDVREKTK